MTETGVRRKTVYVYCKGAPGVFSYLGFYLCPSLIIGEVLLTDVRAL